MKIALFLGAGSSVVFDKPTTLQLREKLIEKYGNNLHVSFLQSFLACDKFKDIEHLLQAIKDIQDLLKGYGGQYFSWLGEKNSLNFASNSGNIQFQKFPDELNDVQGTIEDEVFENYSWKYDKDEDLPKIFDHVFQLLNKNSEKITVCSTNYDRAIEEYCSSTGNQYRCVDGFKYVPDSGRHLWNEGDYSYHDEDTERINVYLYKLHGSLNWKRHTKYGIERTTYERKPTDPAYVEDFLIYPTLSPKDGSERQPYTTIRDLFSKYMDDADVCIVIGFSFRDIPINEIFQNFIEKGKIFISISPSTVINFHKNILNEKPSEAELEAWKAVKIERITKSNPKGKDDRKIHLIQKGLDTKTVKDIVHDIQRILHPEEHPF